MNYKLYIYTPHVTHLPGRLAGTRADWSVRGLQSLFCGEHARHYVSRCDKLPFRLSKSFAYDDCFLPVWQVAVFIRMEDDRVRGPIEGHVTFMLPYSFR